MSHMAFTIRDSVIVDGKGFGNSMENAQSEDFLSDEKSKDFNNGSYVFLILRQTPQYASSRIP